MSKKIRKSAGSVSSILLILLLLLMVVTLIAFVVLKIKGTKKAGGADATDSSSVVNEIPKPVYEATIGDVKLTFESADNLGNSVKSSDKIYQNQEPVTTTEKFIRVVVSAQNKGKITLPQSSWKVGNIVDSEGREFASIDNQVYFLLPSPNLCESSMKPEFNPVPCVKIYEVSTESTGLKVMVSATGSKESFLLDLDVR